MKQFSIAQCRAARGLMDWSQAELASHSNLSESTIRDFEKQRRIPGPNNLAAIRAALEAAGVQFLDNGDVATGPGVVLRLPPRHVATQGELQASADDARFQAARAVDDALSGTDATDEEKAARRGALTDEPAVIGRARGKGRGKLSPDK
ncbi:helix-turn-helix domain-containing protein [Bosea rubneri]|uniref:Helix-turn-helix transcriptional regulator n=1 Tax=Bosea rubneri TaxID=3075434 RepID=A0ABU3SG14_9HYPH|nr:helix-turn-helix transcriptional regulator [Bosea sp. ZW T0_25]MDU0343711.1 helix-turn-helix transcriptional regulator [Bosea sp. ZW T0_25]